MSNPFVATSASDLFVIGDTVEDEYGTFNEIDYLADMVGEEHNYKPDPDDWEV